MRIFKKLALTLLALLAALPALADSVSRERAAEVAAAFFRGEKQRFSAKGLSQRLSPAEDTSPAYAAFNREGGGFVVVALNDAVTPILAYSPDGRFPAKEEMPEPMAWWFSQLEARINSLGDKAVQSDEVAELWKKPVPVIAKSSGKLYETASWGQHEPFNNHCPMEGDDRCVTGCVATAGSIIARYFQWPDAGVGTVPAKPGYCYGPDYPAHDLGYAYDWANMPLEYGWSYTDAQAEAVATLMYDMGTIAQMSYGPGGSSANTGVLITGLKTYMKYDKGASLVDRVNYTDAAWQEQLIEVLDDYGPTLYSANDPGAGGHTFVIDGYDAEGRIHCNWGWGWYNCYCEINSFVPDGTPYNFSANHQVAVGLVPDYDGTSTGRDLLIFKKYGDYAGVSTSADEYYKGAYFTCYVGALLPIVSAFSGTVFCSLYDKDGNYKADVTSGINLDIPVGNFMYYYQTGHIPCDLAPGDRIKVRYAGEYNEGIITSGAGCVTEIIVMEDSGGGEEPDPAAGYSATQTAASTALAYNRASATLTLTFTNPANWTVKNSGGTTVASGTAPTGGPVAIDLSGYAAGTYTILVGSTEDPFSFTITK